MLKKENSSKFKRGDVVRYMIEIDNGVVMPTIGVIMGIEFVASVEFNKFNIMVKVRRRCISVAYKHEAMHCNTYVDEKILTKVIFKNSSL